MTPGEKKYFFRRTKKLLDRNAERTEGEGALQIEGPIEVTRRLLVNFMDWSL